MKTAFYFKFRSGHIGGSYVFQVNYLNSLLKQKDVNFTIIYEGTLPDDLQHINKVNCISLDGNGHVGSIKTKPKLIGKIVPSAIKNLIKKMNLLYSHYENGYNFYFNYNNRFNNIMKSNNIDFVVFVHPAFFPVQMPFAITVWDLAHRRHPYLPDESYLYNNFERKDHFFKNVLPRASMIFTGTNESKRQIVSYYNCELELIKVLPFPVLNDLIKGEATSSKNKNIAAHQGYLLYPAQFWGQKNHILILLAIAILKRENVDINVVFTGSDQGNYDYIKEQTKKLGIESNIIFKGFVERDEVKELYQNALALVFPAIMGPDNLPPIESMSLGCPVLSGNYDGVADQLGDAALIFDNLDENDLADKIKLISSGNGLRDQLIEKGRRKVEEIGDFDLYVQKAVKEINKFRNRIRMWKEI